MQVVPLFNLTHVLSHSLNTMSETIFSNSLIFQEFAKLKYTLNQKIAKSQNLTITKISRPEVYQKKQKKIQRTLHNSDFHGTRNIVRITECLN